MLDHALRYLQMGLSVLPLIPRPEPDPKEMAKRPALKGWKHLQEKAATAEEAVDWWRKNPSRGVGIVTGAVSGVVVVDLDTPQAVAWAAEHLPETPWTAMTGKGEHRYYRHPGATIKNGVRVKCVGGADGLAVDLRADGGYVVAPPSIHPNGTPYRQVGAWSGTGADLPMFPSECFVGLSQGTAPGPIVGIM